MYMEPFNKFYCDYIRKQMETDELVNLTGNVLIISDRLLMMAEALSEYMEYLTDANVLAVASNKEGAEKYVDHAIDYLIFAGNLGDKSTYSVINDIRKTQKSVKIVIWADWSIRTDLSCTDYEIYYQFDKSKPLKGFMEYLVRIKDLPDKVYNFNGEEDPIIY